MKIKKRSILVGFIVGTLLVGCGGSSGSSSDAPSSIAAPNVNGTPSLESISTFKTTSSSPDIVDCAKAFLEKRSCDLSVIQPIGVDGTDLTIKQIESRLVVSHPWMAESFIAALREINDQDLLNLFKPLNSIVLSYDVRPSFYEPSTASMYIDPRNLWRTKSEWDSIYQQDDYRKNFQTEFKFDKAQRYVEQGSYDYVTYSNTYNAATYHQRRAEHVAPGLFRLLAHELAHANDFLPASDLIQMPNSGTIYDYLQKLQTLNRDLSDSNPLNSTTLRGAAQVAFRGKAMTDDVRNLTGEAAGIEFEGDSAAAFYSYSHSAEDVAMLFEAYMMYKKYNAISDFAFVSIPQSSNASCNEWKIQWGQRSRLSDHGVQDRAVFVVNRILGKPNVEIRKELANLPDNPSAFAQGVGWCDSRQASVMAASRSVQWEENAVAMGDLRYLEDFEH
ncbi:hypothetical protein [Vibrio sp. HI00D65]|uniref:hypothetical protein n=1 Tax=Vibrio sp. HI00D65 TaxID=1822216 RepID=UPI000B279BA6|nr:hypothetical protein [Vibrio sp. HI00D65]